MARPPMRHVIPRRNRRAMRPRDSVIDFAWLEFEVGADAALDDPDELAAGGHRVTRNGREIAAARQHPDFAEHTDRPQTKAQTPGGAIGILALRAASPGQVGY